MKVVLKVSGHYNHEGRPGLVGGSLPSGEHADDPDYQRRREAAREALRKHRAKVRAQREAAKRGSGKINIVEIFSSMPAVIDDLDVSINIDGGDWYNITDAVPVMDINLLKRFFYKEGYSASVTYDYGTLRCYYMDQKTGKVAATQSMTFDKFENSIYFSYLTVEDDARAQGFAMSLVIKQVAMAKMMGIKKAKMNADISIGKYAWAKEGVEYTNPSNIEYAKTRYYNWLRNMQSKPTLHNQLVALSQDNRWLDFTKPHEWATYDVPGVSFSKGSIHNTDIKPGKYPVGKAFMLDDGGHGNWDATIDLERLGF